MPSARASRRGAFLNWRFAVYGIQNADCSKPAWNSARLFMQRTLHRSGAASNPAARKKELFPRERNDLLLLLTQSLDRQRQHVARLEEHRMGLHAQADARRRAGGDD